MAHIQPKLEISNGHEGGFLSGLLLGGLVGAATGLLLAPRSGVKTRGLLQAQSLALRDQVTHSVEDARTRAETLVEEAVAKAEMLQQRGRAFIQTGKERLEKTAEAALHAAQTTWADAADTKPAAH